MSRQEEQLDTFSGFKNERNTVPPLILDKEDYSCKGRALRTFGDGRVVEVARLALASSILSYDHVLRGNRRNSPQDTNLHILKLIEEMPGSAFENTNTDNKRATGVEREFVFVGA
jgi:hypothetical protein